MLLRSSSTPISASLLSPFSDSPNRDFDPFHNTTSKNHPFPDRICFLHGAHNHPNLTSFSCQNSPSHHSSSPFKQANQGSKTSGLKSFRRTRSDGNLENLLDSNSCDITEFKMSITTPTESEYKDNITMLHSEPSFSYSGFDEFQDDKNPKLNRGKEGLERTVTIGESIEAANGCDDFILGEKSMCLIEEGEEEQEVLGVEDDVQRVSTPPLYLASGLGIDPISFFEADGDGVLDLSMENFDESFDMEDYYKRMIDQCPFHPIFLRNYAQLLQSKGDLHGAEEYYSRATLADPDDGELWAQYAKLVWDLHQDRDRATSYFKLATAVAPQDCHVLAANASFLWEIDSGEESDEASQDQFQVEEKESTDEHSNSAAEKETSGLSLKFARGLRIEVPDSTPNDSSIPINIEDHYKKMIEENPNNALVLRNYAQFLYETKGDVQGAEEFYSRAMLTDPKDGEIIAQFAKVVWEFYHDGDKASSYFERAVQAAPENNHVLAAYASFLWENQDEEEDFEDKQEDLVHVPLFHKGAMVTAKV